MKAKKPKSNSSKVDQLAGSASELVEQAAALLDQEMAAGIVAAQKVQQRFREERRVDEADFKDALEAAQRNMHDIITSVDDRFQALESPKAQETVGRFVGHAHSVVDLLTEMVLIGAELADQAAQATKKDPARRGKPSK